MKISGPIELDMAPPQPEVADEVISDFRMEEMGPLNALANIPGQISSRIAAFGRGLLAIGALSFAASGLAAVMKRMRIKDGIIRPEDTDPQESQDRLLSYVQQKPNISAFLAKSKRKDIH